MSVKAVVGIDLIPSRTLTRLHPQRLDTARWGLGSGVTIFDSVQILFHQGAV